VSQGVISAVKELDYEISHGRYTLIITATDQCPILTHRLTSTTTVGGTSPNVEVGEDRTQKVPLGKREGKIVQGKCLNARALSCHQLTGLAV
jgi:hypothetical protein